MIKIVFELSEEFIKNNASEDTILAKAEATGGGNKILKVMFDMIGFVQLQKEVEAGKTEFVVTPDKLDEKSKKIYENELGEICMLAYLSEHDKELAPSQDEPK